MNVRQHGDEIDADREETRAKFKQYFTETGMRAFYAIPLNDDSGRVGILGLESSDPDFLTSVHIELLQVLAGQATVALRNAQMYKEVPFISVLEPVLERKRRFMAMEKTRRTLILTTAAAAGVVFLADFSAADAAGWRRRRCAGSSRASAAGVRGSGRESFRSRRPEWFNAARCWRKWKRGIGDPRWRPPRPISDIAAADEPRAGGQRWRRGGHPACAGGLLENGSG